MTTGQPPVASWSVSEVQSFLERLSLPNLKHIFAKNGVDGKDLLGLSKQDLKEELGCTELQARKIIEAVAAISAPHAPYTSTGTPAPYMQPGQPAPYTSMGTPAPQPGQPGPHAPYVGHSQSMHSPNAQNGPPHAPSRSSSTTTTITYQQPVVQAPAPGVMANGYFYQPRERFIGGITWLIAVCFCFPCIFICPVDEREARVNVVVPVQQPPPTQPAASQTMTQTIH
jgi:hypothetical protein